MINTKKVAIIGYGHMGKALCKGLLNAGYGKNNIFISKSKPTNKFISQKSDWIIVAVKPAQIKSVLDEIREEIKDKLLISVIAGISIGTIQQYLQNKDQKVIRLMPTISASINEGVIGYFSGKKVKQEEKSVLKVLDMLGTIVQVKRERDLDIITLIAGCGPALAAYFINMVTRYGIKQGLRERAAQVAVYKTFIGTLAYLEKNQLTTQKLIQSVATKGGVTETILSSLEKQQFNKIFQKSMKKGHAQIKALSKSLL